MSFILLRFTASGEDVEAWTDALIAAGAMSVDASDADADTAEESAQFDEPGATAARAWPRSRVQVLFADDVDVGNAFASAARDLDKTVLPHAIESIDDRDWVRATQAQYGPVMIGDALTIVPTWCEAPPTGRILRLDPGLAFGTGTHPTTRLCLEWLVEHVTVGETLLDYGCGSGILAIAAAKLGARTVVGTDIDDVALATARNNAGNNGVDATFTVAKRLAKRQFGIVVANILANPLVALAPVVASHVGPGGRLALAGVLDAQREAVVIAYSPWFRLATWRASDDWILLDGVRRG
ncbi:MAG TPA: 50S ribosomal protein L11 methyltransferase [Casimicrobiaceae bacterium]|nr:50S ribosomal protein L11 methyltransferase [Casimicrobiaceae bacterium]